MKAIHDVLHIFYFFAVFAGIDLYHWIALVLAVLGVVSYVVIHTHFIDRHPRVGKVARAFSNGEPDPE